MYLRSIPSRTPATSGDPTRCPLRMSLVDVGTIDIGRDRDEIERECDAIGPGCRECSKKGPTCAWEQMLREIPRTKVTIPAFCLDQYEVTNAEFSKLLDRHKGVLTVRDDADRHYPRFVDMSRGTKELDKIADLHPKFSGIAYVRGQGFSPRDGQENLPVTLVSWRAAKLFCEAQGKRLPTEAEWEAAARGRQDRHFPWGNEPPRCQDTALANDGNVLLSGDCPVGDSRVRTVGSSLQDATQDGIHDLGGNVHEWTSSTYTPGDRGIDMVNASSDAPHVIRGGSWAASLWVRTSGRGSGPEFSMNTNVGFRCALDVKH